ncbi:unnamed protein product [Nezara viridula]|uniref:Neuropeptide n=1 Tax=Nezara viridula TaxID=85310 RepID=A0A9P0H5R4_NEZVI|nr:unnamed protein product [Nezara viridula]
MDYLKYIITLCILLFIHVEADMMRKSIVFDKKTPGVFYCPQHKPSGIDKMIVRARPLKKLCEFGGKPIPDDVKPDCYNHIDESDYACKEKKRIMMRLHPPGTEDIKTNDNRKWDRIQPINKNKRRVKTRKQKFNKEYQ